MEEVLKIYKVWRAATEEGALVGAFVRARDEIHARRIAGMGCADVTYIGRARASETQAETLVEYRREEGVTRLQR